MNRRRGKGGREWGRGRKKRERMDEDTFPKPARKYFGYI